MSKYYVNNKAEHNGYYEVHKEGCFYLQFIVSKKDLGSHFDCCSALLEAKKIYPKVISCKSCSEECYSSQEVFQIDDLNKPY